MEVKKSVVVSQVFNREYRKGVDSEGDQYRYKVERTKNTIEVKIGECLTASTVTALISNGIEVTVQPLSN